MKGTIANLSDRGFGFITPENGEKDYFFHARSLVEGVEYNDLNVGDVVMFDVEDGEKGPAAVNVSVAEGGAEAPAADDAAMDADDAAE